MEKIPKAISTSSLPRGDRHPSGSSPGAASFCRSSPASLFIASQLTSWFVSLDCPAETDATSPSLSPPLHVCVGRGG